MPNPIVAVAGGLLGKSYMEKEGARKAGRAQMRAADRAADIQREQYDVSKGYYQPYYQTGTAANNLLAQQLGIGGDANAPGYGSLMKNFSMADYQQDPGYQFRLQEGLKQLQGRAAARGGALSGATLKGVQGYSQGLASQEYGNAYQRYMEQQQNRYNMLAAQQGMGLKTGGSLADLSSQYGANAANIALGKGNIEAQKTAAEYGAYGNMLNVAGDFAAKKFEKTPGTTPGTSGGGSSTYSQIGYQNQGYNPKSGYYEVNF